MGNIRSHAKDLLATIPYGLETALRIRERIVALPPHLRPGRMIAKWAGESLRAMAARSNGHASRRVLLFSSMPPWLDISFGKAVLLAQAGSHVDCAYLPYFSFERADLPSERKYMQVQYWRHLEEVRHPRLRFINLTTIPASPSSPWMLKEAEKMGIADAQYVVKREEIDIGKDDRHRRCFRFRRDRNLECMRHLVALIEQHDYDLLLTPNGGSFEWGAAFELARHKGLDSISFEYLDKLGRVCISQGTPSCQINTDAAWEADHPHHLTPERQGRIEEVLSARRGTGWKGYSWSPQKAPPEVDRRELLRRLKVDADGRPIVLMSSNIPWDSSMKKQDRIFRSLAEWVRGTVSFFARRTDAWLILRVHPGETLVGTGQPVAEIVRQHLPELPKHIRIVGPDDPVNSYDLMELAHFGIVYVSITGLEMAMRGIPAVVAARAHYGRKGFTVDPESREAYEACIDRLLKQVQRPRLTAKEQDLAWCYADVFYFSWQKPFPWHRATFWKDVEEWPIGRILSDEGRSQFGASMDLLTGYSMRSS